MKDNQGADMMDQFRKGKHISIKSSCICILMKFIFSAEEKVLTISSQGNLSSMPKGLNKKLSSRPKMGPSSSLEVSETG